MAHKTWTIVKEVLFILLVLFILFSIVIAVLCYIPKSSTSFSVTMNAIKIAEPGEPVGTVPITIDGQYKTYFFSDRYHKPNQVELSISSIDGFGDFEPIGSNNNFGDVTSVSPYEYQLAQYYAYKDDRPYYVSICFSKDFSYWLISISQWDAFSRESKMIAYYVGSTNENATLEDINNIFSPIDYTKAWESKTEPTD